MPQVCRLLGYIIFFWSNENNEPVHVHVCKGKPHEDATKIWIEDEPQMSHAWSTTKAKFPPKI